VQRSIAAVIVTLDPDRAALAALLSAVAEQVTSIVIVDNSGPGRAIGAVPEGSWRARCSLIPVGRNVGLAAAQNEGIPAPGMTDCLARALESEAEAGRRCAAAGPRYVDEQTQSEARFVQFGRLTVRRVSCSEGGTGLVPADLLIASGMLIPAAVLRDVGAMDESLFVDHVDTDWCLRARAKGYSVLGVCAARMSHRLGEKPARRILGRQFFVRTALRHYFIVRNSVLLYRRAYAPLRWVLGDAIKLSMMLVAIPIFCTPRWQHLAAIARGLLDGLRGRSGPAPRA
jgi:rhamnosyltransferase